MFALLSVMINIIYILFIVLMFIMTTIFILGVGMGLLVCGKTTEEVGEIMSKTIRLSYRFLIGGYGKLKKSE